MSEPISHEDQSRPTLRTETPDPARALWRLWRYGQYPDVKLFLAAAGVTDPEIVASVLRVDQRERRLIGESVTAETYLSAFPIVGEDADATVDLVFGEFLLREELGERPELDEYLRRFPEHADAIRLQVELHRAVDSTGTLTSPSAPSLGERSERTRRERIGPQANYPSIAGFEVLGIIGAGGMGVVYRAWQTELKRPVALKMVLGGAHAPGGALDRFRNEVEAIARLQHPGIVQIHEVGETGGLPYCALEFVEGGNLAQKLAERPVPYGRAASIVVQLARAIHSAHERGIVHRDLKPGNILLTAEGAPKITDFGLAKLVLGEQNLTRAGDVMGTPSYMSPEQAQGGAHAVGAASDIYSLGVIFYEMLVGRPPFLAATPAETMRQVILDDPVPAGRLQPNLPRDLETICLKCLEKDPKRRYESALMLAEDIERWEAGLPIRARPTSVSERLVKWTRRRPAVAALLVGIVGVTLAGFTGVLIQWRRTEIARGAAATLAVAEAEQRAKADNALTKAEAALYLNRLSAAAQQWSANNARGANQLLDRCRPDQRGWEWNYLKRLCHGGERWLRDTAGLLCLARSPDGRHLAAAGWANAIRVWDAETGHERFTLSGHGREIYSLAYHPDGTRLASGSGDKTIRIWDTRTGQEMRTWRAHEGVRGVAFSPDGRQLASCGDDGLVQLWNAETYELVRTLDARAGIARALAFSPDGRSLASGYEDKVAVVWSPKTGERLRTLSGHELGVISLAFFADGRRLVTGSIDATARLWDLDTGKVLRELRDHRNAVNGVTISPDERTIATSSWDRTIRLWDLRLPDQRPVTIRGHEAPVVGAAFLANGRQLVSAADDRTVRYWSLPHTGECRVLRAHAGGTNAAEFSPDGHSLLSAGPDGSVRFWDAGTGESKGDLPAFGTPVAGISFSRDGSRMAAAALEPVVKVWDVATRRQIISFGEHTEIIGRISLSPDGTLVASTAGDTLHIWNVADGSIRLTRKTPGRVHDTIFSPDGRRLAYSGGIDGQPGEVHILEVATGKSERTLRTHEALLNRLAFSHDNRLLAGAGYDKQILVWDLSTGRVLRTYKGHNDWIFALAFSPDSRRLASAGMDWTTKLWDLAGGKETLTLQGHTELVYSVSFSPDSRRLATASQDGTVRVWDASPVAEASAEGWLLDEGPTGPAGVAFSPDGRTVATSRENGEIQLWDARNGWESSTLPGHDLPVRGMIFAPDRRLLATVSDTSDEQSELKVWDLATGTERARRRVDGAGVLVIGFLDGARLVTLGSQGFSVWNDACEAVKTIPQRSRTPGPLVGAVSPDGTVFVANDGRGALEVWDSRGGRQFLLEPASPEPNLAVEFSLDGRWLASATTTAGVRVWDTTSWREQERIKPAGLIRSMALAPDGRTLALGDETGIVQLWSTHSRSMVSRLEGYSWESIARVRFSPDGRTLASAAKLGSVVLWAPDQSALGPVAAAAIRSRKTRD